MKTFRKLLVIWATIFSLLLPVNKAFAGADFLIELGRWIPLGLKGLTTLLPGSDSEVKKNAEEVIKKAQGDAIRRMKAVGREITFDSLYEQVIINKQANVLTFKVRIDKKETLLSIGMLKKQDEIVWIYTLAWDDLAEYKANSSKKALAARYVKYAEIDPGPVDEEDPKKTPETATTPQPQPTPQSTPTATATPETAPANTAPPAPSTALSNNP